MSLIHFVIDLFLHLDQHLANVLSVYGTLTYVLLFVIIFCETGLVVTPILPGDSLLFAAGSLVATGSLSPGILLPTLVAAAFCGDVVNYGIGRALGPRVFRGNLRFLKREYLDRTNRFYDTHGPKTLILARFVPIVRTFAPFVAGVGRMRYARFLAFSITATVLWVGVCTGAGYLFGNIPAVKGHFSAVILGIIGVSLIPVLTQAVLSKRSPKE